MAVSLRPQRAVQRGVGIGALTDGRSPSTARPGAFLYRGGRCEANREKAMRTIRRRLAWNDKTEAILPIAGPLVALAILQSRLGELG